MSDFSRITVVSVTGLQAVAGGAAKVIELGMRQLPGSRGLLLSPARPEGMCDSVRHIEIKPFGYLEYSLFVLYSLGQFIETDFALIVQNDGWVLDAGNWRPEFMKYDYLGAPVHLARVTQNGDVAYRPGFSWVHDMARGAAVENIFNGGFSLRSRRLLNAPRDLGLEFSIPVPRVSERAPHSMQWDGEAVLEDVWLCLSARKDLETAGMKFPPLSVATSFSIEHAAPVLHSSDSISTIFGHHSRIRKISDHKNKTIRYEIPKQAAELIYGEKWIMDHFRNIGYQINWKNAI